MNTTFFTAVTAAQTDVCVHHAALFAEDADTYARVDNEIIKVTKRVGGPGVGQITMVRGMLGTTAGAHSTEAVIQLLDPITAAVVG